jgi:sulfur-oxidizing protein SoxZ
MSIKMRARRAKDGIEIVALIAHPMETGERINPQTKEKIAPHFIQKVTFTRNGKELAVFDLGSAVSHDPILRIKLKQTTPGERLRLVWSDNRGETGEKELVLP